MKPTGQGGRFSRFGRIGALVLAVSIPVLVLLENGSQMLMETFPFAHGHPALIVWMPTHSLLHALVPERFRLSWLVKNPILPWRVRRAHLHDIFYRHTRRHMFGGTIFDEKHVAFRKKLREAAREIEANDKENSGLRAEALGIIANTDYDDSYKQERILSHLISNDPVLKEKAANSAIWKNNHNEKIVEQLLKLYRGEADTSGVNQERFYYSLYNLRCADNEYLLFAPAIVKAIEEIRDECPSDIPAGKTDDERWPHIKPAISMLNHPNREIRITAIYTLRDYGPRAKAAIPILTKMLETEDDPYVKEHIEKALRKITFQTRYPSSSRPEP